MLLRKILTVKNDQLVVKLPPNFTSGKRVIVTVEEENASHRKEKINLIKVASKDRKFQLDVDKINEDFDPIEEETL